MSKMAELAAEKDKWSDDDYIEYLLDKIEVMLENKQKES
tara:strand:+ start:222 stop:338 length:117 start_codon:yes stop_codon:yes gene_type:complete